jgi:DNA-binding transcriptional LysR family regulator
MPTRPNLDLDLLRTLVCLAEERSFTRAAERVGRTQSAVTLQIQKLEAQVRQLLVVRSKGGPIELTRQGRGLVEKARTILSLNDEAFDSLAPGPMTVKLRLASAREYSEFFLAGSIEAFQTQYPNAVVEVVEGFSCQIAPQIRNGLFDVVVCEGSHTPRGWEPLHIWTGPLRWVTSKAEPVHRRTPLPISLSPADCPWRPPWMEECFWRSAPLEALKRVGREHLEVSAASSLEGLYAPVLKGAAVTISLGFHLPEGLRCVEKDEGLPDLPNLQIVLLKSRTAQQPHSGALADAIVSSFSVNRTTPA